MELEAVDGEARTRAVNRWQQQLRRYIRGHTPSVELLDSRLRNLGSQDGLLLFKWTVKVANPLFIDAWCWLALDFVDLAGNRIEPSDTWRWFLDETCDTRYVRIDRGYRNIIAGSTTQEISGAVKIPVQEADRIVDLDVHIERTAFDSGRFEPRWEPGRDVVSDVIEKQGRIFAIRARTHIVNREYYEICLTPVVWILGRANRVLKSVRCSEWRLGARCGGTFEKYVRLSQEHAEKYRRHVVDFTDIRCLFRDDTCLVRTEGRKSGFLTSDSGERRYEQNSAVYNGGFEWAKVVIEYARFRNTMLPEEPIGRSKVEVPPRSSVSITKTFSAREVDGGNSTSIQVKPMLVELGDFYEIP